MILPATEEMKKSHKNLQKSIFHSNFALQKRFDVASVTSKNKLVTQFKNSMKKKLLYLCFMFIAITSCSEKDDVIGEEPLPVDPKLNITEATLSCDGDSVIIESASGQDLVAVRDTVGEQREYFSGDDKNVIVTGKEQYCTIDMGWYLITQVKSNETRVASKMILKVKANNTGSIRKVPLTVFSRKSQLSTVGIYTETNFVQVGD